MDGSTSAHVLRPGGPSDPDASRTAAILEAYLAAAAARDLRRRVWRDVLVIALAALTLALVTRAFTPGGLAQGLAVLAAIAVAAAVWEWHSGRVLDRLLAS